MEISSLMQFFMPLQVSQKIVNIRMEIQNPEFCDSRLEKLCFSDYVISLKIKGKIAIEQQSAKARIWKAIFKSQYSIPCCADVQGGIIAHRPSI